MSLGVGRSSSNQGCCRGLGGLGSAQDWSHLGRVQESGRGRERHDSNLEGGMCMRGDRSLGGCNN